MTLSAGTSTTAALLADRLELAAKLSSSYAAANPFPHAVIDGLFDAERLKAVADELPRDAPGWKVYDTGTELKRVLDRPEEFSRSA